MSIKLTSPILVAGVHVPVDGATLSYAANLEADLVNRNMAVYVSNPAQGGVVPVMASKNFTGGSVFSVGSDRIRVAQGGLRTVLFGDSMLQSHNNFWYGTAAVTAMSRSAGVVTATISGHSMPTGRKIRVINAVPPDFNYEGDIIRTGVNTFTYPSAGPDGLATRTSISVIDREWVSPKSPFLWANGLLGGSLRLVKNLGVGGNTTGQMLARLDEVIAQSPDVVVILGMYNDIGLLSPTQTTDNLKAIYDRLTALGILVVAVTGVPLSASGAKWSAVNVEHILSANRFIRAYAVNGRNFALADAFRRMVDKHNTTNRGAAVLGAIDTDFVHPSPRGAFLIGRSIYDALVKNIPPVNWAGVTCAAETAIAGQNNFNAIDEAPNTMSGGSITAPVTGTAASGVTVERDVGTTGACVASVVMDTDGTYLQRASITPGGVETWNIRSNSGGVILTRLVAGERRRLSMRMRVSGLTAGHTLASLLTWLVMAVDGKNYYAYIGSTTTQVHVDGDCSLTLISEPFIVPSGVMTNAGWAVQSIFSGAFATAINIDVGDVTLTKTSDEPA